MKIKVSAIKENGDIDIKYTGEGENISPGLEFENLPAGTKSLVLIVEDPDAPTDEPFLHWLVWNMKPEMTRIEEGEMPTGVVGRNSTGEIGYIGPFPPRGEEHRYFFKIFALDEKIEVDPEEATVNKIMNLVEGHILAEAGVIGKYKRE